VRFLSRFVNRCDIAVGLACVLLLVPCFCHAAAGCSVPVTAHGWQIMTVHSGGLNREVLIYVPASAVGHWLLGWWPNGLSYGV
jgi:hypothetical protein